MSKTPATAFLDVFVLVRRQEDGETDILDVTTEDLETRVAGLEAEEAEMIHPASFEIQTWAVDAPAPGPKDWSAKDLHTLIITAGEIAATYGAGTDGLDGDDVLSTRQRAILAHAARDYRREIAG